MRQRSTRSAVRMEVKPRQPVKLLDDKDVGSVTCGSVTKALTLAPTQ